MHYENLFAYMPAVIDCIKYFNSCSCQRVIQERAALSHTPLFYKSNPISYWFTVEPAAHKRLIC